MLAKLCRICPNTDSWKRPTGNKKGLGDFAGTNGFGVEEWLSRKEWLLSGYKGLPGDWRYAHITALWTKNNAYAGQDMRVYLLPMITEHGSLVILIRRILSMKMKPHGLWNNFAARVG